MFACILRTEYRNALSRKESLFTNLRSVLRNARDLTGQRGQLDESDSVFQTLYSMLSRQTYSSQAFGTGVERLFSCLDMSRLILVGGRGFRSIMCAWSLRQGLYWCWRRDGLAFLHLEKTVAWRMGDNRDGVDLLQTQIHWPY